LPVGLPILLSEKHGPFSDGPLGRFKTWGRQPPEVLKPRRGVGRLSSAKRSPVTPNRRRMCMTCLMTEDEIAAMRARDAMLDQLKRLRPHGLRLTPQNLVVAAELVRFDQAEAYEVDGQVWIRST
jgi:hypothetical protein